MADNLKRPPSDATDEPLSKRPCPETAGTNDAAIKPRSQRRTRAARLTMENLRLHDKMNEASKPETSKSAPSSNSKTTRSDKVNPTTDSGFQDVLCPMKSIPAHNTKEILDRLNRTRMSPPPAEWQYKLYCEKINTAGNEPAVVQRMLPLFLDYDDGKYNIDIIRAFSAVLPKGLGFLYNNGISAPQPDFLQGLTRDEFLPFNPSKIPGAVIFKDDSTSTTLPHFAGEWTSRTGDMADATL